MVLVEGGEKPRPLDRAATEKPSPGPHKATSETLGATSSVYEVNVDPVSSDDREDGSSGIVAKVPQDFAKVEDSQDKGSGQHGSVSVGRHVGNMVFGNMIGDQIYAAPGVAIIKGSVGTIIMG